MSRPMRIALLSTVDAADRRSWSGIPAAMLRELRRRFDEVVPIGPFPGGWPQLAGRAIHKALRTATGFGFDHAHAPMLARHWAPQVERAVERARVQAVVAPAASTLLAGARLRVPVIALSDTTLANMVDYYAPYAKLVPCSLRGSLRVESQALQRAAHAVFPSEWAACSAMRDHGADPARVHVVPFGPNFSRIPERAEALRPRPMDPLRLLFLGVEWERKGGPLVLEAWRMLRARGIRAELTIAGTVPPIAAEQGLAIIPFIDKNSPGGERRVQELLLGHHLLFVPSLAECYGIVYVEAASCGTPVVARRTGGVEGAVAEGRSGHLLDPGAGAGTAADLIEGLWRDRDRLAALQATARAMHEATHNWHHWGQRVEALLSGAAR